MSLEETRSQFLDKLYQAAIGGEEWREVLRQYAILVGAQGGVFHIHDLEAESVGAGAWLGYSDQFVRRGAEWFGGDPWVRAGRENVSNDPRLLATGFVFQGAAAVSPRVYRRSSYYNEYVKEVELVDSLSCAAFKENRYGLVISAHTLGRADRLFSELQRNIAGSVLGDFRRALHLHLSLSRNRAFEASASLWAATKLPVILVHNGCLVLANDEGQAALAQGDIVGLVRNRITFANSNLREIAESLQRHTSSRQVSLVARSGNCSRWLVQFIRFNQLSGSLLGEAGLESPALLVVLTPVDIGGAKRDQALQSLQGLTKVERAIATDLANGIKVTKIADQKRLSVATVRWHVRHLIEKLAADGLADLQRILALLLPFG